MTLTNLDASIPANNQKIIELYNKLKNMELDPSPLFQRKLVWKRQHKFNFINTILMNFPFPEVYIAPGKLDTDALTIKDLIVDGQQRLSTIVNYIEGKDVFALENISIPKFYSLTKLQKTDFLNYEVSVRYLKNANENQIIEIFKRINSTEYALNATERTNAQWGDSEFICFGKQIIENDLTIDESLINYKISKINRKFALEFFHEKNSVFTENDVNRMIALQYILVLLATVCEGEYFKRTDKIRDYIEKYNEEFAGAGDVEFNLMRVLRFIDELKICDKSYWFNKANLFTLCVELYKVNTDVVDKDMLSDRLRDIESMYDEYISRSPSALTTAPEIPMAIEQYFNNAREGVNNKNIREARGVFIRKLIDESIIMVAEDKM